MKRKQTVFLIVMVPDEGSGKIFSDSDHLKCVIHLIQ